MGLEHLISREASQGTILFDAAGTDVPSLCTFLEILLGNGPEYDSGNVDYYSLSCECFHIDNDNLVDDAPKLMSLNQSPRSHMKYLQEKAAHM
jgi:hypothetical protein